MARIPPDVATIDFSISFILSQRGTLSLVMIKFRKMEMIDNTKLETEQQKY